MSRLLGTVAAVAFALSGAPVFAADVTIDGADFAAGHYDMPKPDFVISDKDGREVLRLHPGGCIAVKPAKCDLGTSGLVINQGSSTVTLPYTYDNMTPSITNH